MTEKLEQTLIKKYPVLFKNTKAEKSQSPMAFGCCIEDGWYEIFNNLCEFLTLLANCKEYIRGKSSRDITSVKRPNILFEQVKEKFGFLRVYWIFEDLNEEDQEIVDALPEDKRHTIFNHYTHQVDTAISYVEFLSGKICKKCGHSYKSDEDGTKFVCDNCHKH